MRASRWTCFAVLLITMISYWGIWNLDFTHYGDVPGISFHTQVRAGLTADGIGWAFAESQQPLTAISHMLDFDLYGSHARGHHFSNFLLHALNVLLLFSVLSRMTARFWPSAAVVALFAIHPLQVESVAWLEARPNLLSSFFFLLTISAYLQYVTWRGTARYLVTAAFFCLTLAANPTLITLPFALLLLDAWPLGRFHGQERRGAWSQSSAKELAIEKLPLLALAVIAPLALGWMQPAHSTLQGVSSATSDFRLAEAAVSSVGYIGKTLYPLDLSILYPHPESSLSRASIAACFALLGLITFFVLKRARQYPHLTFGWLWFLILLAPQIGVLPFAAADMADRYVYLPLIGLLLAIVFGISTRLEQWKHQRPVLAVALGVCLLALMTVTRAQVPHWKNSVSVWEHALALSPDNPTTHRNIAIALNQSGKSWETIEHLERAVEIAPEFLDARSRLGRELTNRGELGEATTHLAKVLASTPGDAATHYNLGRLLFRQRKTAEAIDQFQQVLAIQDDHLDSHRGLGVLLAQEERYAEAQTHLRSVLEQEPMDALTYFQLGLVQSKMHQIDAAIASVEKGLSIAPKTDSAYLFLARLQEQKKSEQAAELEVQDVTQRAQMQLR